MKTAMLPEDPLPVNAATDNQVEYDGEEQRASPVPELTPGYFSVLVSPVMMPCLELRGGTDSGCPRTCLYFAFTARYSTRKLQLPSACGSGC